jgi:hypothetical protein
MDWKAPLLWLLILSLFGPAIYQVFTRRKPKRDGGFRRLAEEAKKDERLNRIS